MEVDFTIFFSSFLAEVIPKMQNSLLWKPYDIKGTQKPLEAWIQPSALPVSSQQACDAELNLQFLIFKNIFLIFQL